MAEQAVELQPGESKQVSFEATPHEARVYQVSVDGLMGSFEAIAPVLATLYGLVTHAEPGPGTGLPYKGVEVQVSVIPPTGPQYRVAVTTTATDGSYLIEGLEPRDYYVSFTDWAHPIFVDGIPTYKTAAVAKILVGGNNELNFELGLYGESGEVS